MKQILCYGDSNTHGYVPGTGGRFPPDIRWTGKLQTYLGGDYHIIEEGLNGRTAVLDDPFQPGRNGYNYLVPCLASHKPLDLVILMLGTNDIKPRFHMPAPDIARGIEILALAAAHPEFGRSDCPPRVLIISPVPVTEAAPYSRPDPSHDDVSVKNSRLLAKYYKRIAEMHDFHFLDAAPVAAPSEADGIHLDECGHDHLAHAIFNRIKEIFP